MIEIAIVLGSFWLGWKAREWRAMRLVRRMEKQFETMVNEEVTVHQFEISHHDGTYIVHDKKTNQFILQGTSYKDVIDQLKAKYPNTNMFTSPAD